MKSREEAEARADELFPFNVDASVSAFNKAQREAFLQCYDEMEKARQKKALIELTETGDSATNDKELRKKAENWLENYLSTKLRKSSSEYDMALKSYRFVLKKVWEFATCAKREITCGYCVKRKEEEK